MVEKAVAPGRSVSTNHQDIELRLCITGSLSEEDVILKLTEVYVK